MTIISRYSGLKTQASETRDYLRNLYKITKSHDHKKTSEDHLLQKAYTGLSECANYLVFHDYYTVDERKLVKAKTCKQSLLCPFCAARRAGKNVKAYGEKVENLMTGRKDLIPVMITFTVKNQSDLSRVYKHMNKSLKRLMDRRRYNKCHGKIDTEMKKVAGAIASREVTYNEEKGEWHPHVHMVALLDDFIDQKKLSEEWFEITGDSKIVSVNMIKQKNEKNPINKDSNNITDGLLEVFKYALKFGDLPQDKLWEAYKTLRGKRMVTSYGDLYGVQVPESLTDDPYDDLPYIEMFYKYGKKSKSYQLEKVTPYESINNQEVDVSENIASFSPVDQRPIGRRDPEEESGRWFDNTPKEGKLLPDVAANCLGEFNSSRRTRITMHRIRQSK